MTDARVLEGKMTHIVVDGGAAAQAS